MINALVCGNVYYAGSKAQWQECGGAQYIPEDVCITVVISQATSGQCGKNAVWNSMRKRGKLTISGTGPMYDYAQSGAEWVGSESMVSAG